MKSPRPPAAIGLLLAALALAVPVTAVHGEPTTDAPGDEITLEKVMAAPDWIGNAPEDPFWSADGRAVYYERKRQGQERRDLWRIDLAGTGTGGRAGAAEARKLDVREKATAETGEGDFSEDRRFRAYVREGDVYVREVATGKVRQLTRTAEEESDPRFLVGDRRVAFRRGTAVFIRDLDTGVEIQPAPLLLEKDPAAKDDAPGFLAEQELRLFDVLREERDEERAERREDREARQTDPTLPPLPWYLGDDVEVLDSALSPTAEWMVVVLAGKDRDEGKADNMPRFVTETGYVDVEEVRPKVGTAKPESPRLLLLDLRAHKKHEIDLAVLPGIREDPLKELREKAEAERKAARERRRAERRAAGEDVEDEKEEEGEDGDQGESREDEGTERERTAEQKETRTENEGRGTETEQQQDDEEAQKTQEEQEAQERQEAETRTETEVEIEDQAESDDDRQAAEEDEEAKEAEPRAVEISDLTWSDDGSQVALQLFSLDNKDRWLARLDLAGRELVPLERITDSAWINYDFNQIGWMRDNRTLWYLSEESGWSHLYLRPLDGAKRQLTSGEFEVSEPALSRDGSTFYLTANREHPGVFEAYRLRAAGGQMERLTRLEGISRAFLSPDERRLLVLHSRATRPPELYLQDARPGAAARKLTDTVSPAFAAIRWSEPEVVPVPSSHAGRPVWSRVYTPAGWTPDRRWPAVVFVHGAGYLQNAHKGWSSYFREFMFHSFLTRRGYVVIDMDYRASAGYGRDWRTAIYRQMGWPEVEDLEDGVAWLLANKAVDRERVGVYGGSYGGFLTFMSMFRKPDLFACGAALRPVSDWAHYNHEYTSNILNTPEVDPEAYRRSSPIEYAAGLARPLLIAHGMVDDNVVFQDSVRLVQRLIELEKQDFETAIYPVEPHGFRKPSSWLDEYRRVFKLFEANLGPGASGEATTAGR